MIFRWLAWLIDVWLAAGRLGRSVRPVWRVLPGDLLGLLVMRATGARPSRVGFADDVSAILVEDGRTAAYLDAQLQPVTAQTLGRYVFSREPLSGPLIAHELEHVRQWSRLGPLFLPAYGFASAAAQLRGGRPYHDNRFEAAARRSAEGHEQTGARWLAERLAAIEATRVAERGGGRISD